jgi:hypothetical protein
MDTPLHAPALLDLEARALLTRLGRVKPFVLNEPMLLAASLPARAQIAIERYLSTGRRELHQRIDDYRHWLQGPGLRASPEDAHRRFVFLRLRFNTVLAQLDLFSQVISQRSESDNGVWMAGLDVASADALALPAYYDAPPVVCYLDRGIGAAIRRARTRLPGGGENPVAIIRVPRERMVGSGIASSLVHEVGHQGAALLGLVESLRPQVQAMGRRGGATGGARVWELWSRWISEVLADFWSIARVGVASTLGLMGVVGLPRPFVFRINEDDPHPIPWIRVRLSAALGQALYPHVQWDHLARLWESYYPLARLDNARRQLLANLQASMADLTGLIAEHRPPALKGSTLPEALGVTQRRPDRLADLFTRWDQRPALMYEAAPTLVFATLGQAKQDRRLTPEDEGELLSRLLTHWAMRSALKTASQPARFGRP